MKLIKWIKRKKKTASTLPLLEEKAALIGSDLRVKQRIRRLKRWYKIKRHDLWFKMRIRRKIRFLMGLKLRSNVLSVIRWVIVDFLRAKPKKFWGIYQFVALPGEGKTLSMVAHMERVKAELGPGNVYIATNFFYKNENMRIDHWTDMIKAAKYAEDHGMHSIVALDEIHTTFDASDWQNFPAELLSLLSFNRKFGMQFLCSAQIYDRIPRKVRDIANFTIICKNTLGLDRHFVNFYFSKANYEDKFAGKRSRCEFIRTFVASDGLYGLYNTLAKVDKMVSQANDEKQKREEAFKLLFGHQENEEID